MALGMRLTVICFVSYWADSHWACS